MSEKRNVLMIALDGAEPRLIERWSRQGLLPNVAKLHASGAWARVTAPRGFGAGAMWPSVYTGMNIANHGRYYFEQIRCGTYRVERVSDEASVRSAPVWKLLSDRGLRVCVVDGDRAPLAEDLNGCQIADWTLHDPLAAVRSRPRAFAAEVVEKSGANPIDGCVDLYTGSAAKYLALRDALVSRVAQKTAMACHYRRKPDWDFFMVTYGDPHDIGHMCWHLHDPSHPHFEREWAREQGDPVRDVYLALDAALGELLGNVDSGTFVVLFAGPGMEPDCTGNFILGPVLQRLQNGSAAGARGVEPG